MADHDRDGNIAIRYPRHTRGSGDRECDVDVILARHAARGPFTRRALLDDRVPEQVIDRPVRSGQLTVLWSGVYWLAGPPLTTHSRHLAANLACGPRSVCSFLNAAVELGLLAGTDDELHVTVPPGHQRRPKGVTIHRAKLSREEVQRNDGLLVTTPARTLQDLAASHPYLLARAVNEAYALRLLAPGGLAPRPGQRGAAILREVLGANPGVTRTELERLFRRLVARAGLPGPESNVRVGPWEVDFLWPAARLVVETDGYAAHASRRNFERDRRKDADLQARGYRVIRLSYRQITREPERTVATLAALLLAPRG